MSNLKIVDGQNISLVDALTRAGFQKVGEGFELEQNGKKFVLVDLQGVVKEISTLGNNDENIEGGNDTSNLTPTKNEKRIRGEAEGGDENPDNIQLAGEPINKHSIDQENAGQTKALEQTGFHVVGDDGYQSGGGAGNSNKEKGTVITSRDDGRPGLQLKSKEQDEEDERKKKSKKS